MVPAPPVRRRFVGRALRRYRETLGFSLEDAALLLECDKSKISRIETGQRGIRPKELRELLAQYGAPEDEQVMGEQLAALARAAADSGRITVQVLPFESGAHAAAGDGSLSILQFAAAPSQGLVHLGGIGGGVCLEDQTDIDPYLQAFQQLRAFAMSPAQSALLLRGLAGD